MLFDNVASLAWFLLVVPLVIPIWRIAARRLRLRRRLQRERFEPKLILYGKSFLCHLPHRKTSRLLWFTPNPSSVLESICFATGGLNSLLWLLDVKSSLEDPRRKIPITQFPEPFMYIHVPTTIFTFCTERQPVLQPATPSGKNRKTAARWKKLRERVGRLKNISE